MYLNPFSKASSAIAAAFAAIAFQTSALAGPSHKDPSAPLDVHGKVQSPELLAEAQKLYSDCVDKLVEFKEQATNNRLAKVAPKAVGQTHNGLTRLDRLGRRLSFLGEPAGGEFSRRAQALKADSGALIAQLKGAPQGIEYINTVRSQIQKSEAKRKKTIASLQVLVDEEKWLEAETLLNQTFDLLEPATAFLTDEENQRTYGPFAPLPGAIGQAMTRIRGEEGQAILRESRKNQSPDFAATLGKIDAAVQSAAMSGSAEYGGEVKTGPQLVAAILDELRQVQVATMRCRALDWAIASSSAASSAGVGAAGSASSSPGVAGGGSEDPLAAAYRQFAAAVQKSLARLIENDAARVASDGAPALYLEYLAALAPIAQPGRHGGFAQSLEPSLSKLAGRSPALDSEVKAYKQATSELMRWRRRLADRLAQQATTNFPAVDKQFFEGTKSEGAVMRYFPERNPDATPQFLAPTPAVMPVAVEKLIGKTASANHLTRLPGESKAAIAAYFRRAYANVPAPIDLAAPIAELKTALMTSDAAPPLSLEAVTAIHSAERGDLVAVGGEITGIYLEAVVTRFASLPPPAGVLAPIHELAPGVDEKVSAMNQALMRFDLSPRWVHGGYFFYALPAAG